MYLLSASRRMEMGRRCCAGAVGLDCCHAGFDPFRAGMFRAPSPRECPVPCQKAKSQTIKQVPPPSLLDSNGTSLLKDNMCGLLSSPTSEL